MRVKPISVLLIEDDLGYARLIEEMIKDAKGKSFTVEHRTNLGKGMKRLTAGGIETNTLQSGVDAEGNPERIGNLLAAKAAEGDGVNPWLIGCYGGRKVYYDVRPTTPTLFYRRGMLLDKTESPVLFPTVRAGQILHNASAPIGSLPPGSTSAENDPRNAYVSRVEFDADAGSLSLYFDNEDRPLTVYQPAED